MAETSYITGSAQVGCFGCRITVEPVYHVGNVAIHIMDYTILQYALRPFEVQCGVNALIAPSFVTFVK